MSQFNSLKPLVSYLISAFLISTGIVGLASPATLSSLFGQPVSSGTTAYAFVQCFAARNLTLGLAVAEFIRKGNRHAIGTVTSLLAVDGLSDAWVTWREAGFIWALPHLLPSAVIPFVGRWLME